MAAANGVSHIWVGQNGLLSVAAASAIWVGQNGLLSVAAASAVVRGRVGHEESKASGAFILTGRHYPRGPQEDFGIKYNMENGGPAPEAITGKIYENMETIREVLIAEDLSDVDLSVIGITSFASRGRQFYVEVFDSAYDYVELMKDF